MCRSSASSAGRGGSRSPGDRAGCLQSRPYAAIGSTPQQARRRRDGGVVVVDVASAAQNASGPSVTRAEPSFATRVLRCVLPSAPGRSLEVGRSLAVGTGTASRPRRCSTAVIEGTAPAGSRRRLRSTTAAPPSGSPAAPPPDPVGPSRGEARQRRQQADDERGRRAGDTKPRVASARPASSVRSSRSRAA
jgi:hypothetical protein